MIQLSSGKSQRVGSRAVRRVMRLTSDMRDLRHDPNAASRLMVETLCDLIGGTCGFHSTLLDWRRGRNPRVARLVAAGPGVAALTQFVASCASEDLWQDPSLAEGYRLRGTVETTSFRQLLPGRDAMVRKYTRVGQFAEQVRYTDHLLGWYKLGPGRDVDIFSLHRWDARTPFTPREVAVGRLLCEELRYLRRTGRMVPDRPPETDLPPRLQEVLSLLLKGETPKSIAWQLDLSVHTVREHIQRLYDRLGVRGRDALLARYVR
jgi:DNA-binding CsgD family transcriptional regulator